MKIIFGILVFIQFLWAIDIKPTLKIDLKAAVLDMAMSGGKIYVATDKSRVYVLDKDLEVLQELKSRKVKDFLGTLNDADIYSVDVLNGEVIYLSQAEEGYAELYLYKDGKSEIVLDSSKMLYAKAAKFVDKDRVVLALMSDEVVLYDLKKRKILKRAKAGEYFFSAMTMEKSRKYAVIGDEGGEVIVIDPKTLKRIKLFKDINKDKILSIDMSGSFIAAGSRADKTLAVYNIVQNRAKTIKNKEFFVYVVGVSPSTKYIVYGDNEKYILKGIDKDSLDIKFRLVGHKNIVNVVRFLNESEIITGSETGEIIKWRVK